MPASPESLYYPLDFRPEIGEIREVTSGVNWLRLPLPFELQHINVWLLRDGPGWALVDTGLYTRTTREVWEDVLERRLAGPLTRLIVTHLHPDHVGCAGWLCARHGLPLYMTADEFDLCRLLIADTGQPAPPEALRFYRAAGLDGNAMQRYAEHFGLFGKVVAPLPETFESLRDGMRLQIGAEQWEVVEGNGHSPRHACLLNRGRRLLIAGDQLLPTISSNISVYPRAPNADPLRQWFESLQRLEQRVEPDVLVLPAHGKPFLGLVQRARQLAAEHEVGLARLRRLCREPRRAVDVFPALFKTRITEGNLIMAAGEAVAHLNHLVHRGEMAVEADADGINWYRMNGQ